MASPSGAGGILEMNPIPFYLRKSVSLQISI
jgi:hypothetical protein